MTDVSVHQSLLTRLMQKIKHQKHWYCPWRHDMPTSLTVTFTCWIACQWSLSSLLFFLKIPFLGRQSFFWMQEQQKISQSKSQMSWTSIHRMKLKSFMVRPGLNFDTVTSLHVSLHHFSFLSESISPHPGNTDVLRHSGQIFVWWGQRSAFAVEERGARY